MIKIPISKRKIKKNLFYRLGNRFIRELEWILITNNLYKRNVKKRYPINTPGEVIWCNPVLINSIIFNNNDIHPLTKFSSSEDGDWDNDYHDIKELNIYKAFYDLIKKNKSFKETNFYNPNIKSRIDFEKNSTWEYISEYDYDKRFNKIKNLINTIKQDGYKSQTQMNGNPKDEIIVKIGRYGEIFFFDGIHRFCTAKILGIEKIPVIVKSRHTEWIKLKKKLYSYALSQQKETKHEGKLYHKLAHPDLEDIPYVHDNEDRLGAILTNINPKSRSVLDLGANLGFFTIKLSALAYKCTAVEQNNQLVYFLKKFNQLEKRFVIIQKNILNLSLMPVKYDVVLALNVFQHFLKTEPNYFKFIRFLKNLKMKEMFFEPHNPSEIQFKDSYKNLSNEEFIKLIIDNTNLTKYKKILDCYEDRVLYHLW